MKCRAAKRRQFFFGSEICRKICIFLYMYTGIIHVAVLQLTAFFLMQFELLFFFLQFFRVQLTAFFFDAVNCKTAKLQFKTACSSNHWYKGAIMKLNEGC